MAIDTAIALTSLTDAKAFLKITGSTEDTIVGDLVNAASAYANSFTGRYLLKRTGLVEYYDGDGSSMLMLRNYPVVTLSNVYDDIDRAFGATTEIPAGDLLTDKASGILRTWNNTAVFTAGVANIKVAYEAGYALASVPYDLKLAIHLIMAAWYKNAYQFQRLGIESETKADHTVSARNEAVPAAAAEILKRYISHGQESGYTYA